jgi:hypothetical protein
MTTPIIRPIAVRLALAALALGIYTIALAYYWTGNTAHEWLGLAFAVFLLIHVGIHRRWFARAVFAWQTPRQMTDIALTAMIALICISLLTSSVLISETLLGWLGLGRHIVARQIHAAAGWWLLISIGAHLGFRWPVIAGAIGFTRVIRQSARLVRFVLGAVMLALAVQGIRSAQTLGVLGKLFLQPSPEWWDFEQAGTAFLLHAIAVIGLFVLLSHQLAKRLTPRASRPLRPSASADGQPAR